MLWCIHKLAGILFTSSIYVTHTALMKYSHYS